MKHILIIEDDTSIAELKEIIWKPMKLHLRLCQMEN